MCFTSVQFALIVWFHMHSTHRDLWSRPIAVFNLNLKIIEGKIDLYKDTWNHSIIKLQKEEAPAIFFNISLLRFLPWIFLNWFVLAVKKLKLKIYCPHSCMHKAQQPINLTRAEWLWVIKSKTIIIIFVSHL